MPAEENPYLKLTFPSMSWNYSDSYITVRSHFLMLSKLYFSTPSYIPPTFARWHVLSFSPILQITRKRDWKNPFIVNWLTARVPLFYSPMYCEKQQGSEDRVIERHEDLPFVIASCLCKPDYIGLHFTPGLWALPTRVGSEIRCSAGKLLCSLVLV